MLLLCVSSSMVFLLVQKIYYLFTFSTIFAFFFSKFQPNYGDVERESKKQLEILNHIQNRIPIVNTTKAANRHIMEEQRSR